MLLMIRSFTKKTSKSTVSTITSNVVYTNFYLIKARKRKYKILPAFCEKRGLNFAHKQNLEATILTL